MENSEVLMRAKKQIECSEYSLIIVDRFFTSHFFDGRGVRDLLFCLENSPDLLFEAAVFDKVIGKAAADICVLAKVKFVYGLVMSDAAVHTLNKHKIPYTFGKIVDKIINRTGDGFCPIESAALPFDDPHSALTAIKSKLASLTAK